MKVSIEGKASDVARILSGFPDAYVTVCLETKKDAKKEETVKKGGLINMVNKQPLVKPKRKYVRTVSRRNKKWTNEEDNILISEYFKKSNHEPNGNFKGSVLRSVARRLKRSEHGIALRINRLKLKKKFDKMINNETSQDALMKVTTEA